MTPFEERVYAAVSRIPKGRVTTYKLLAEAVGCGSCRAVGQALKRNPLAPAVPCHRVIASDLRPGGFKGARDGAVVRAKLRLLSREGVRFTRERLEDPGRIYRFSRQERPRGMAGAPKKSARVCATSKKP